MFVNINSFIDMSFCASVFHHEKDFSENETSKTPLQLSQTPGSWKNVLLANSSTLREDTSGPFILCFHKGRHIEMTV